MRIFLVSILNQDQFYDREGGVGAWGDWPCAHTPSWRGKGNTLSSLFNFTNLTWLNLPGAKASASTALGNTKICELHNHYIATSPLSFSSRLFFHKNMAPYQVTP